MADNDNDNGVVVDEKVEDSSTRQRGSTGAFIDRLMDDAAKGGVKIVNAKDNGSNGKDKSAEPVKTDDKFDYSPFKDINDDDYKKVDGLLGENKIDSKPVRYHLINQINNAKKEQRLAMERQRKIEELEKTGVKEVEVDKKFTDTISGLKSDFFGTYSKLQEEYKLPDITTISKQIASGNTLQAQVAQFQTDVLIPELEEKHKIEKGTFVFDPADAWKAGTPSYEYRIKTADKETQLRSAWQNKETEISNSAKQMIDIRNQHIKELKEFYFPVEMQDDGSEAYKQEVIEKDKKYTDMLAKLDSVYDSMKQGKVLQPSENPFIFKNVFRGLFYDDLVKIDIARAINKLHQEYAKYGLRLPKNANLPDDFTKMKGDSPDGQSDTFKVGDTRFSPMNRMLKRVGQELTK